ncbi:MAG: hypothetical protein H6839_06320 [Planctomycetes bacterium]|nr:hypothetical protein [Planctomycetota bacterium]
MTAPFRQDELFDLAARYNQYIEPLQILIYIPTLLIFALLLRGTKQDTSRGTLLLIGAEWAMVGVLFFFNIMANLHWLGYVGGAAFLAAGLYYAVAASHSFPPHFRWRRDNPSLVSIFITAFAVVGYPGISWALSREYPFVTTYGLMPGSVALLTLGVAISARPAPRLWLLVPPMLVALSSVLTILWWQLWEDLALIPLALLATLAWLKWRSKLEGAPTKDTIRFDF